MHKKESFHSFALASAICFLIVGVVPNSALAATFQRLGHLPGGGLGSGAGALSADGSVVVGASDIGLLWAQEAFRWTSGGGMVGLGHLPGGGADSSAEAVSADGSVVVGYSDTAAAFAEAFRWTSGGGMVGLGHLPGGGWGSWAYAVSSDGSVIVGTSDTAAGLEAFRWTSGGGVVGLGHLVGGGIDSRALAVTPDGSVVVGYSDRGIAWAEPFRWTAGGGMLGLGHLPGGGLESMASGVSADGSVIVGRSLTASGNKAFIWDALNGMRDLQDVLVNDYGLNLTGWTLLGAGGVSADGLTVVGAGGNPSGNIEAWIATLEPTIVPATKAWGLTTAVVSVLVGAAIVMLSPSHKRRVCTGSREV
jgi:probable HAF family extracellular repeat protein